MTIYKHYRFPPAIIQYAVWLYYRFNLSQRDIEDLLAERGITVSYESIHLWCIMFGSQYARCLKRKHQGYGDAYNLFNLGRHLLSAEHYRNLRRDAFVAWADAVA